MARSNLTKEAIKYIIRTYDCEFQNYTFSDIASLVSQKFGVTVTTQAIHKCYHKYKNIVDVTTEVPVTKMVNKKAETSLQKRPIYSSENTDKPRTFVQRKLTKEELDALLSPAEKD
ncbi:hypothetical protein [Acinetobacter rathckeae]|uniref:hypothetical protein n=1 Tax=Acinetobacter rathckeae TaxID=2605272 RepID=UPI0018A26C1B|nr:hypothetical protein [Acinetobacter rathckeae]MBF7696720.1 hypothetical protein [Acinetobacter rathckeae]